MTRHKASSMKMSLPNTRRWIGGILLVSFFFLPLHVHLFTPVAQLTQECSCFHSSRTQLGSAPAPVSWVPSLQEAVIVFQEPRLFGSPTVNYWTIRAPPSVYSL